MAFEQVLSLPGRPGAGVQTDGFMTLDRRLLSNLDVRIPTGDGDIWSVGAKNMGAGYVCIRLIASRLPTTRLPPP
ncbi:hypothetical protein GLI01_10710 [Gluconacetobacter liquefaciens]|nr:hypothetical protein GLI01_10710 [Gluconacetobacter liquefaciens]